jgi:hypothetical protein
VLGTGSSAVRRRIRWRKAASSSGWSSSTNDRPTIASGPVPSTPRTVELTYRHRPSASISATTSDRPPASERAGGGVAMGEA